jgi:hypothetical protein
LKVLHRRSTKRVAAFTTAFAMAAFLVQLAAPAAFAANPPDAAGSFFPVDGGVAGQFSSATPGDTRMTVLSDKADGVDTTAHLTALTSAAGSPTAATPGATVVQWYFCDAGLTPPNCPASGLIGSDSTATTPVETPGYAGDDIDDAWSIGWDIPASLDNVSKDIVVEGCNGAPDATFSNCAEDAVTGVLLDDSGSGNNPQTTAGEITAPIHGSAVSQDVDSTATASTSVELTAVVFGIDDCGDDSGSDSSPEGCEEVDENQSATDTTPNTTTATAKTWSVTLVAATMDGDSESALTLYDTDNASAVSTVAQCDTGVGTCAYDRHYFVMEPGTPGTAAQVAVKQSADVTADATCLTGPSSIFSPAGSTVNLTGCVFDAFRNAVGSEGVFWSLVNTPPTGGGFFVGTPQLVSDTAGHATAAVSSASTSAGSSTVVTFCLDHDKNGVCDGPAPKTANFTITWGVAGGGNTHARTVSLRLRDSLTARGKVTATGFAACAANVPVKFQKRVAGHWKTLKKVTTSATGSYRAHVHNTHGRFRSLAPKVTMGTDICKRAVSPRRRH